MEIDDNIIEFINKIIDSDETIDRKRELLSNYAEILLLTKMADSQTIEGIDMISFCLPEIVKLREKLGQIDVLEIVKYTMKQSKNKPKKKTYKNNRHYDHYSSNSSCSSSSSSNSCGTSSYSSSRC